MKRKVPFVVLFSVMMLLFLTGCDSGLEITSAKIDKYPNRLVYFAGSDTKLDLSGGVVTIHLRDGETKTLNMTDETVEVIQKIDFNTPGVYTIELYGPLYFPVQVVDKNYVDRYMK